MNVDAVADVILDVVGGSAGHHDALVTEEDRAAVDRCLHAVANYQPINDLERALESACKVRCAVATSSGTAALHAALTVAGVKPGDVVVVPALTFAGCASAVVQCGAKPVFVDADPSDFGPSVEKLRSFLEREARMLGNGLGSAVFLGRSWVASIIAVHILGRPCHIEIMAMLARDLGIPLIEDAAQALGSIAGEKPCGSWGTLAVLSTNYNKIVTGGGGGAVLTDDPALAARVRRLVTTARIPHPWAIEHDAVGWNYRMPTTCAALAGSQLSRLPRLLRAKNELADAYEDALEGMDGVVFHGKEATGSNRWLNVVMVAPEDRDLLLTALHKRGLMARALFTPLHMLRPYQGCMADDLIVAEDIWKRAVCLPSGVKLGERFL